MLSKRELHRSSLRGTFFLLILVSLQFSVGWSQSSWELKKDRDGIKVYVRELDTTKIKEYRAIMRCSTTMERALEVLLNGDSLYYWNFRTSYSKTIRKVGDDELIIYMINELPWPLLNRDNVTRVSVHLRTADSSYLELLPAKDKSVPKREDLVRVTNFRGFWTVVRKEKDIEIIQQMYGDPGGGIPAWLLNSIITDVPYETFKLLREKLE